MLVERDAAPIEAVVEVADMFTVEARMHFYGSVSMMLDANTILGAVSLIRSHFTMLNCQ